MGFKERIRKREKRMIACTKCNNGDMIKSNRASSKYYCTNSECELSYYKMVVCKQDSFDTLIKSSGL